MKAATILPQNYLHLIEEEDYHMCLACFVAEPGFEEYTMFYKRQGNNPDKFVIMDNGVIETGKPLSVEKLVEKAKIINASEIVIPDEYQNCDKTLTLAAECIPYIREHLPNVRIMVVPQGKSFDEWLFCANELINMDINTLGIPKSLYNYGGMRARLEAIQSLGHKTRGLDIHLLGCWENPLELSLIQNAIKQDCCVPVRGVDSAIAYVYSAGGILFSEGERPKIEINFKQGEADPKCLLLNIQEWKARAEADIVKLDNRGNKVIKIF